LASACRRPALRRRGHRPTTHRPPPQRGKRVHQRAGREKPFQARQRQEKRPLVRRRKYLASRDRNSPAFLAVRSPLAFLYNTVPPNETGPIPEVSFGGRASPMILRNAVLSFAICFWLFTATANAADRLILRNLDIIIDRTVTALDEDGLVLDAPRPGGSNRIAWDEVERGKVAVDQSRFDALLADLGPPLYRIRQRLKIGDYDAVSEPAELLYPRFAGRKSQTAYLVCQATMWSRVAAGRREDAVEPYLRCFELLRSRVASGNGLPGTRRLKTDAATALSSELAPVWFDSAAAKSALAPVQQAIRDLMQVRPIGVYVYYATLAVAAGETSEVERILPLLNGASGGATWQSIIRAQQELSSNSLGPAIEQLRSQRNTWPALCRPIALLVLGQADAQSANEEVCRDGILSLLALPAIYGSEQPELAAAGLYHAATALDKLKDASGAAAVRRELASRYAGTHFGAKPR